MDLKNGRKQVLVSFRANEMNTMDEVTVRAVTGLLRFGAPGRAGLLCARAEPRRMRRVSV